MTPPIADVPPRPVRVAAVLWIAAAALGVAGQFVTLTDGGPGGPSAVVLLAFGFMATVAPRVRAGPGWARILLTLLGVLMLVVHGYALAAARDVAASGGLGTLAVVLLVALLGLLGAAVVTMYAPGTGAWFARAAAVDGR